MRTIRSPSGGTLLDWCAPANVLLPKEKPSETLDIIGFKEIKCFHEKMKHCFAIHYELESHFVRSWAAFSWFRFFSVISIYLRILFRHYSFFFFLFLSFSLPFMKNLVLFSLKLSRCRTRHFVRYIMCAVFATFSISNSILYSSFRCLWRSYYFVWHSSLFWSFFCCIQHCYSFILFCCCCCFVIYKKKSVENVYVFARSRHLFKPSTHRGNVFMELNEFAQHSRWNKTVFHYFLSPCFFGRCFFFQWMDFLCWFRSILALFCCVLRNWFNVIKW